MEATGETVYDPGFGEPDFDTPKHLGDASVEVMKTGCTHYRTAGGIVELKKVLGRGYCRLSTAVRSDLAWPEARVTTAPRGPDGG